MFMTKKDTSITSGHLFQQIQKCTLYCIHQIKVNPLVPASLSLLVLACGVVPSDGEEVGKHLLEGGVRGEDGLLVDNNFLALGEILKMMHQVLEQLIGDAAAPISFLTHVSLYPAAGKCLLTDPSYYRLDWNDGQFFKAME